MALSEKEQFLKSAEETTTLINNLIADNRVFIPRKNPQALIGKMLMKYWTKDVFLDGGENIDEAITHLGQKLTITPNHKCDGDHRGIVYGLEQLGYGKLALDILFKAGLKMERRRATKVFLGADHSVFTETPAEIDELEKWQQELQDNKIYQARVDASVRLNFKSVRTTREWQKAEKPVLMYPGATRQRGPLVISPPEKVSAYVKKGMWFLPLHSTGMEQILPAEQNPRILNRTTLHIRAGKCYPAEEVIDLLKNPKVQEAGINAADVLMARITVLNPSAKLSTEFQQKYFVLLERDDYMQKPA